MRRVRQVVLPIARDLVLNAVAASPAMPRAWRRRLMASVGHNIDATAEIAPKVFLGSFRGLSVGGRSFINYGCFFDLGAVTVIGADVQVGYEAMFVTCSHERGAKERRAGRSTTAPIRIGNGCWIGARALILPGVTIPDGTVIAAGAVVISSIDVPGLYAGVPARRVGADWNDHGPALRD